MKIVISSGHGKYIRGASGYPVPPQLDEVNEARRMVEKIADYLRTLDVDVKTFHDDTSTSQDENLRTIVNYHNSQTRDLDVSVHFNAYDGSAHGTEVLYVTQDELADEVCDAIVEACGSTNRGPKYRGDLFFLNNTEMPAILIETVFCDNGVDSELYQNNFDDICRAIAETIGGRDIPDGIEPPERPEPPPLTGDNRVNIIGAVQGNVSVFINGQHLQGSSRGVDAVFLNITMQGDVTVSINGQDFHSTSDAIPENQTEITATVFGGSDDYNTSAYDPDKVLNDTDFYIALPDRFEGDRPMVRVINQASGLSATASIEDVGPWNTDDPYWSTDTRPQAESGTDMSGRDTNGAGIDLSPALASAIGISGKGKVDWQFIE